MSAGVLARRAGIYTLANLANSAIPFLLLPLLTRVLSPTEYGIVVVFATSMTVLGAITGFSVHGAVNIRYHDRSVDIASYTGTVVSILAASTTMALLAALLLGDTVAARFGIPRTWLIIAVLASASQFLVQIRLVTWQARGMATRFGMIQVLQTATNLLLSLLLVVPSNLTPGFGWQGRATGIAASAMLAGILSMWLLLRQREITWGFRAEYWRDALRFGVPLVPHVLGSIAIANSDRMVVAGVAGLHEAGIYAASMQLGLIVSVLADAVVKALTPWIYMSLHTGNVASRERIVKVTYGFFTAMIAVAMATAAGAPWLLGLIGSAYRGSGEVLGFVALGGAFSGMYLMVVSYVFFANRNERLSAISLTIGALNLALTWWLVRDRGAVGAAQAYALSQFLMFACTWFLASRCCPMPWRDGLKGLLSRPTGR